MAGILVALAAPLLVAGLTMPAISVTKFAIFEETYSILGGVFVFWEKERYGLFWLVFFFSIVFPSAKIVLAALAWSLSRGAGGAMNWLLRVFAAVSKWSMLDVFIVALMVLVLEGSLLASADIHLGIVLFAASVILSTFATQRLAKRSQGTD